MKAPLGFDNAGNPIEVPETAAAWRVRRALGRPGRPQTVYDPDTGRQLELPITATVEDLRGCGCPPARYRLEAIDAESKAIIPAVVAFVELLPLEEEETEEMEPPPSIFERQLVSADRAMKTIERQAEAMARTMEALARAFGPVQPAPGAEPSELMHQHSGQQAPPQAPAFNLGSVLTPENIQAVGMVGQQLVNAWKAGQS